MGTFIDWDNVSFGSKTDAALAKEIGSTREAVSRQRRLRCIAAFQRQYKPPKHDWETVGLGNEPDEAIAARIGSHRKTVALERQKRKIPPFIGHILNQEGVPVRSLSEAMYDAYLHWKGISHEHEMKIEKYRADFKVGDEYHEVVGLLGYKNVGYAGKTRFDYGEKLRRKLDECREQGLKIVTLTVREIEKLYKGCPINLKFKLDHNCLDCGEPCNDYLMKGRCNKCYMKLWHAENADFELTCSICQTAFPSSNPKAKYCSRECYHASHRNAWPDAGTLLAMLKAHPRKDVAAKLGVTYNALSQHMRKFISDLQ